MRAAALEALQRIDPAEVGQFHPDLFEEPKAANATSNLAQVFPSKPLSAAAAQLEPLTYDTYNQARRFPDVDAIEPLWRLKDVGLLPEHRSNNIFEKAR